MADALALKKIAKNYANALAEITLEEKIISDLELVAQVFSNQYWLSCINSAHLGHQDKEKIIDDFFASKISSEILKLLKLLVHKNRLNIAPFLFEQYKSKY